MHAARACARARVLPAVWISKFTSRTCLRCELDDCLDECHYKGMSCVISQERRSLIFVSVGGWGDK